MDAARRSGCLLNVPRCSYQAAWDFQRTKFQERVQNSCVDTLFLVEHEPVFTLGRTTKEAHWQKVRESLEGSQFGVYEIERGGSVTYHGPGQIIAYPILRLRDFCPGPKVYVGMLQEVILRALAEWGIEGHLKDKFPGVWVKREDEELEKICAIGVRINKGVTMHGLALNVDVDLSPFDLITPCGIEDCQVTSMEKRLATKLDSQKVRVQLAYYFAEVFGLDWKERWTSLPV